MKHTLRTLSILSISLFAFIGNGEAQSWTQKTSLTTARGLSTGFAIGNYGFIGTGQTATGFINDFWKWNQTTNTWSAIANYPGTGEYGNTSFAIGGKGYTCLGFNGSSLANDLWEYDTATNVWSQKASFPGAARYGAFVFVIGTKAFVGCGEPNGQPYDQDMWMYNSVTDTWTQVANYPGGKRTSLFAFSMNGYGYVGGGGDGLGTSYTDMHKYDTTTDTWTTVASIPESGVGAYGACFVIDTLAYVGTGKDGVSSQYQRDVWSYNATTNTWGHIETLPGVSRWLSVGFSINTRGYIGMGQDSVSDYLNDYWEYAPASNAGIENIHSSVNINLYPNPSNGMMNLAYTGTIQNGELQITDLTGRLIDSYKMKGSNGKMTVNETSLSNGIYFYQIIDSGKLTSSGKFIIAK